MQSLVTTLLSEKTELIAELRRVIRVTSKGKRIRRIKCRPGFKSTGRSCKPMTGSEKRKKKLAIRKAVRTKRANPSIKRKANRKRLKAMRKRKAFGL